MPLVLAATLIMAVSIHHLQSVEKKRQLFTPMGRGEKRFLLYGKKILKAGGVNTISLRFFPSLNLFLLF